MISDFTTVEINASRINSSYGSGFSAIANATLKYINDNGGLQTKYGHNSISDYDKVSGINIMTNKSIDYVVFMVRNPSGSLHGFSYGSGYGGVGAYLSEKILMSDSLKYPVENGMIIGIGHMHMLNEPIILVHEFAHALLGNNSFHTSGGNHYGTYSTKTFIGHQSGYGLFCSGLRSVNGYERWRLGWQSSTNLPYKIAANGTNSEINQKFTGTQTPFSSKYIENEHLVDSASLSEAQLVLETKAVCN